MATKNKDIVFVLKMRNEAKAALRAYRGDLSSAAKAMSEASKQARDMARHTRSLDSSMSRMGANINNLSGKFSGATVALRDTNKELTKLATTANRSVKLGQTMSQAAQNVQTANSALRLLNSALNGFAKTAEKTGILAQKMQAGAAATRTATTALRQATTQAGAFARAAQAAGAAMGGIGGRGPARGGSGGVGGITGSFAMLAASVGDVRNLLLGAAGAMGTFMGAQALFNYTDTFTAMNSQLRLVTSSTTELTSTYEELYKMAQNTRQSLDGTVNLYARIVRATKSMNMSQEDTIGLTDAINKSVAIFGGPAASAAAALFQLSQGFAAGQLRGEELNSVLEQSPRLAQAIADGMGVAVGSLRQLAESGQMTTEKVLAAIMSQREVLDEEFARVGVTVGQAFTVANNALLDYLGNVDQASRTSQNFSRSVMGAMDILRDPSMVAGGVRAMEIFGSVLQSVVGLARFAVTNIEFLIAAVAALAGVMAAPAIMSFAATLSGAGQMALFLAGGLNLTRLAIVANIAKLKVMQMLLTRTGLGLGILAVGTGIAAWSKFTGEAADATGELARQIDIVKKAYDEAGGSAINWNARLGNLTATQAEANLRILENQLEEARKKLSGTDGLWGGDALGSVTNMFNGEKQQINHLIDALADGKLELEDFRTKVDEIGQATESDFIRGFAVRALEMADAFREAGSEVAKGEALLAMIKGTATDAQIALITTSGAMEELGMSANDAAIMMSQYQEVVRKLQNMNPVDKKIAERIDDIKGATETFAQAQIRLDRLRENALISEAEYNDLLAEQERLLKEATDAAWGLNEARKALKSYEDAAKVGAIFDDRRRAIEEERQSYAELIKTLQESGAEYADLERARLAHIQTLNNLEGQARFDLAKNLEANLRNLEEENRLLGLNTAQRTRLSAMMEAENAIREAGITDAGAASEALRLYMAEFDKLQQVANRGAMGDWVGTQISDMKRQALTMGVAADQQERLNKLIEFERTARENGVSDVDSWRKAYIDALDEVKAAQDAVNQNFALGFGEGLREFAENATNVRNQAKDLASGIAGDISGALKKAFRGDGFDLGELFASIGGRFIDMAVDNLVGNVAKTLGGAFDDGMTSDPIAKARIIVDQQQEAYMFIVGGVDNAGNNFVAGLRRAFDQIIAGVAGVDPYSPLNKDGFQGLPSSSVRVDKLPPVAPRSWLGNDTGTGWTPQSFNQTFGIGGAGADIPDAFQRRLIEMDNVITETFKAVGASTDNALLNLIGRYEGTDKGRGYNETLAYGKFTGGNVNLTGMTLDQVRELQTGMLRHPDNNFNSSAVGRYQIVRKTMDGLRGQMGLSGDELFTPELQDRMALALAKGRGNNVGGLRNEWEGLRGASSQEITNAYSAGMGGNGVQQLQTQLQQVSAAAQTASQATQQVSMAQQNASQASQQVAMVYNQTGQSAQQAASGGQQASQAVQQLGSASQAAAGQMQGAAGQMQGVGGSIGMVGMNAQVAQPGIGNFGGSIAGLLSPLSQAIPGLGGFAQAILGLISSMGSGGGMGGGGGLFGMIGGLFGMANGGIMSSNGPLPLATYAKGGVAKKPQVAVFGEAGMNEAFVPLPDGKSIPVSLGGNTGGGNMTVGDISIDIKMQGSSGDENKDQKNAENVATMINKAIDQKMSEWYMRNRAPGGMIHQDQ